MPPKSANVGGQNPEFVLREFQGMNVIDARECINDNEFFWCENAIPIAPGSLYPTSGTAGVSVTVGAETGAPTYTMSFGIAGVNYDLAVWAASGYAYVINLSTLVVSLIGAGFTSGQTYATPYNDQGVLIIDPAGYWDWNITAANVLTPQNNSLTNATVVGVAHNFTGGSTVYATLTGAGSPTGGSAQALYEVSLVSLTLAGIDYAVGDTITLTDGNPTTPAQIVVASISGGGATGPITGITLSTGGSYPGPIATGVTAVSAATGPTGTVTSTTGAGSIATFSVHIVATGATVVTRGYGYTGATYVLTDTGSGGTPIYDQFDIATSGVIGGTGIATYAGRVWLSSGRTVYFTDINSYNSFGGVGGSFSIPDSYLVGNITALFAANNYLYIFGATSIDALSNVTVAGGVTSFSRINVTGSIGTAVPVSIFAYYRSILFYHPSGLYMLAGATPEKISDKISKIISQIVPNGIRTVYSCQVLILGELCAAFLFQFDDIFTKLGLSTARDLMALYFRGRWWVHSMNMGATVLSPTAMISVSQNFPQPGISVIYAWSGNSLYLDFSASVNSTWLLKTKLYDAGAPLTDKQSINAAIAGQWAGLPASGVTLNIDTEISSVPAVVSPLQTVTSGYHFNATAVNNGGTQYLGLTATGSTDMSQIDMLALRGTAGRDKLQ